MQGFLFLKEMLWRHYTWRISLGKKSMVMNLKGETKFMSSPSHSPLPWQFCCWVCFGLFSVPFYCFTDGGGIFACWKKVWLVLLGLENLHKAPGAGTGDKSVSPGLSCCASGFLCTCRCMHRVFLVRSGGGWGCLQPAGEYTQNTHIKIHFQSAVFFCW